MEIKKALIDNGLCKWKISVVGDQINGKKERSRKIDKTVKINAADILSNIAAKISHTIATNNFKDAGVVTTVSEASEDRKTSSNLAFTDTTLAVGGGIYKGF